MKVSWTLIELLAMIELWLFTEELAVTWPPSLDDSKYRLHKLKMPEHHWSMYPRPVVSNRKQYLNKQKKLGITNTLELMITLSSNNLYFFVFFFDRWGIVALRVHWSIETLAARNVCCDVRDTTDGCVWQNLERNDLRFSFEKLGNKINW